MSRVLVIEPSKATAKFIQATLLKAGFECDLACTYDGAQQLIAANEYFVGLSSMLLDDAEYGMGIDLLLENSIPAIAVTSSLDEQALGALAEKSIVDYVLKSLIRLSIFHVLLAVFIKTRGSRFWWLMTQFPYGIGFPEFLCARA